MVRRKALSFALVVAVATAALAALGTPGSASVETRGGAQVIHEVQHDSSPPLADLIAASANKRIEASALPVIPRRVAPTSDGSAPQTGGTGAADAATQTSATAGRMPSTIQNFEGVHYDGSVPPDTNGDVGPTRYVESVNTDLAIYNKTGTLQAGSPFPASDLFNGFTGDCEFTNDGDAIIQYDAQADRWMFTQFANVFSSSGPYSQCFAVSQTPDPAGAYYRYQFAMPGSDFFDYPKTGVWNDAYYMTANQYAGQNGDGVGVFAFDRSDMLAGNATTPLYFHLNQPNYGLVPSDIENSSGPAPGGTPNHLIEYRNRPSGDELWMYDFHADFATPANSTLTGPTALPVKEFDPGACRNIYRCVPQKGTSNKLDSITDLLMYQLEYYNYGGHEDMTISHSIKAKNGVNTAIRWYQLRSTASGPWGVYQQGTFSPDSLFRWLPSGALDANGDLAVGYSVSGANRYPSIRYSGRTATDPLNKLSQGEAKVISGQGSETKGGGRWGDYSAMQIDPSDGCTFWYTNEYYPTNSAQHWDTRIASFKFPGC
jgi:hypothetical protein